MANQRKEAAKVIDPKIKTTDIMLKALEKEDQMSDWERDFVVDVSDWFYMRDKALTDKQFTTLERIYRHFN